MSKFALRARWVLPITAPPIEGGVVTIINGRIADVGRQQLDDAPLHDLGDVALLPGLVNAHTHLEFSGLTAPLGQAGMPLPEWIRLVITSRKQREDSASSIRLGLAESARAGVTTIGDIATVPFPTELPKPSPATLAFQEVIGFSAARSDSVFAELEQRLSHDQPESQVGISPHAPYTVHPELVERLVSLACQRDLPIAMHLAESREELQLLLENVGPFRELLEERSMWDDRVFAEARPPLHYLNQLSEAPRVLVVHGNYLDAEALDFLAKHDQMSIVYCPRTHAFFGHEAYPLPQMLERGINVALGTDSRASNPDLSILAELRRVSSKFTSLDPQTVLKLGTIAGAKALGRDGQVGSLEVGKLANLTALDCGSRRNPYDAILHDSAGPKQTWIRGIAVNAERSA